MTEPEQTIRDLKQHVNDLEEGYILKVDPEDLECVLNVGEVRRTFPNMDFLLISSRTVCYCDVHELGFAGMCMCVVVVVVISKPLLVLVLVLFVLVFFVEVVGVGVGVVGVGVVLCWCCVVLVLCCVGGDVWMSMQNDAATTGGSN